MKKKLFFRMTSIISTVAILLSGSGVSAQVLNPEQTKASVEQSETSIASSYEEIASLPENIQALLPAKKAGDVIVPSDNAYELTVQHTDGSYTTEVYAVPVKYTDTKGDIHYVDTSMQKVSFVEKLFSGDLCRSDNGYTEVTYATKIAAGLEMDDAFVLRVSERHEQQAAYTETTADGAGKVIYPGAFGEDTYVEYINTYAGFKENIVLKKNIGRNTFDFEWQSDTHVPVLVDDDKAIQIVPKDDPTQVDYTISPLYVYDSFDPTTAEDPYSHKHWTDDCRYAILKQEDGRYIIRAIVSEEYLNHPETVYPVTIDPSVVADSAHDNVDDGFVKESAKTGKYGTYDYLQFGYLGGKIYSYVRFITLPRIEKGAYFTSATFKVTFRTGQNTPAQMKATAKEISGDFDEKTLCWNNRPAHKTVQSSVLPKITNGYLDYYNFTVTKAVRNWYSDANYGLMFDYATETYNDYNSVVSSEGDAGRSPKLTINYTKPAAQTAGIANDTHYYIKNVSTGKYLGIKGTTSVVGQSAYDGKGHQLWKVHFYGSGGYTLTSVQNTELCMKSSVDWNGGGIYVDINPTTHTNTGMDIDDSLIMIVPTASGNFRITSRTTASFWAMTAGRNDASSVNNYMYTGATDQQWVFEKYSLSLLASQNWVTTGQTLQINPSNKVLPITWSSSNTSVATVSSTGKVTGRTPGTVTITAKAGGITAKYTVTVKKPVVKITLKQTSFSLKINSTLSLSNYVTVSSTNNDQSVSYTSSNTNVATVGSNGVVTPKLAGTTTVTIKSKADTSKYVTCSIRVSQVLTGADTYITDQNIKNTIINAKNLSDVTYDMYLSGNISLSQMQEVKKSAEYAANLARADFIVVNDQSNFAYQYFKGRNYQNGDVSPFNRELTYNASSPMTGLDVMVVQRGMQAMGIFEPDEDYKYGTYDLETYNAAKAYPNLLLNNKFDAESYRGIFNASTISTRTPQWLLNLQEYSRQHRVTQLAVAARAKAQIEVSIKGGGPSGVYAGRADVLRDRGEYSEIWEVKHFNSNNLQLGNNQLKRYQTASESFPQNFKTPLERGYDFSTFYVPYSSMTCLEISSTAIKGLVFYREIPIPSPAPSYADVPFPEAQKEYEYQLKPIPLETVAIVGVSIVYIAGTLYFVAITGEPVPLEEGLRDLSSALGYA